MDSADSIITSLPTDELHHTGQHQDLKGYLFISFYGAYERLLKQTFRIYLETLRDQSRLAISDVSPPLRAVALRRTLQSIRDRSSSNGLWWHDGSVEIDRVMTSDCTSLDPSFFPDDGSFFRESQVRALWTVMEVPGDAAAVLGPAWEELEVIRRNRNKIAHGELSPHMVGSRYAKAQLEKISVTWRSGWHRFVEACDATLQAQV